jgi:hypothetical protein
MHLMKGSSIFTDTNILERSAIFAILFRGITIGLIVKFTCRKSIPVTFGALSVEPVENTLAYIHTLCPENRILTILIA